ncbi:biotin carboxyl carrier protein of acetyl-CoA carboxylase 1, chloroplastic-like [Wolffia australiana]
MASASVPAALAAASSVVAGTEISSSSQSRRSRCNGVSLRLARRPKLALLSSKAHGAKHCDNRSSSFITKSQASEVVGDLSNDSIAVDLKPKEAVSESTANASTANPMSEEAVSAFLNQVASLIKLVDSRDVVELQLKQQDCELVIRKKEALPAPPPSPVVMMQPQGVLQQQYVPLPPAAAVAPALASSGPSPSPPASPPPAKSPAKSSHPPLKSPMAGTFYRSPGPGQAPFVKVGDKVSKGQVLCIIEAMKLMNEIEADQAGTVVEILAEDAKPVGIEQPLFLIEP